MANNKAVQISVQLDVEKLNEGASSLSGSNGKQRKQLAIPAFQPYNGDKGVW